MDASERCAGDGRPHALAEEAWTHWAGRAPALAARKYRAAQQQNASAILRHSQLLNSHDFCYSLFTCAKGSCTCEQFTEHCQAPAATMSAR